MTEIILTDKEQAIKLARQLRLQAGVNNVRLYQKSTGIHLSYEGDPIHHQAQLLARAERALDMAGQGYQVVWAGHSGLVVGPQGQVYEGTVDSCTCLDMQRRLAKEGQAVYQGACKHMIYRALDLAMQANRLRQVRPAPRRRVTRRQAEPVAQ